MDLLDIERVHKSTDRRQPSFLIFCPSKPLQYRQLDVLLMFCLHLYATSTGLITDF